MLYPLKILFSFFKNVVVILLVLFSIILLSLQLQSSQNFYLSVLNDLLKPSEVELKIGKINGFFPFNWRINSLKVADSKSEWIEVNDLKFDWLLSSLINQQLEINTLSASSIIVYHIPSFPISNKKQPQKKKDNSDSLNLPFALKVNKLNVNQVLLAKQLLIDSPNPIEIEKQNFLTFSLFAKTFLDLKKPLMGQVQIKQLDYQQRTNNSEIKKNNKAEDNLKLDIQFNQHKQELSLQTEINVQQSLLQKMDGDLIKLPEQLDIGDIKLGLSGEAPLSDWQGKLSLAVDNISQLDSSVQLKQGKNINILLDNDVVINEALLQKYNLPKALSDIQLSTSLSYINNNINKNSNLVIDDLLLSTFYAQLNSTGSIDLNNQSLDLKNNITINELFKLNDFLSKEDNKAELKGKLGLSTAINGKFDLPEVNYSLLISDFYFNDINSPSVKSTGLIKIVSNPIADVNKYKQAVLIKAKGQFQQLVSSQLKQLPEQTIHWNSDLTFADNTQLRVNTFSLDSQLIQTNLEGKINTNKLSGEVSFNSVLKDLSLLLVKPEIKLSGKKQLTGQLIFQENADDIQVNINGQFEKLQGLPAELMVLIGEKPNWNSQLSISNKNKININQLKLDGAELILKASSEISLINNNVNANIKTDISDLSSLTNVLDYSIAGNLHQEIQLSGTIDEPRIFMSLQGKNLLFNEHNLGQLSVQSELNNILKNPAGNINIDMAYKEQILQMSSNFKLKDKLLKLSQFDFQAPESMITGELKIDLENKKVIGEFDGQLLELSKLAFLHQQDDLDGDIAFNISLDTEEQKNHTNLEDLAQNITYKLNSKQISNNGIGIKQLALNGKVKHLQQAISIDSELDIKKLIYGKDLAQQQILSLNLKAKGNPENIQIDLNAVSEDKNAVINLTSMVEQKDKSLSILLTKLDGQVFKLPLELLNQPYFKVRNNKNFELTPLKLSLSQSELYIDAMLNQDKDLVNLNFTLNNFPLDILSQLNLQQAELAEIKGNTDLNLSVNGALKNPDIKLDISIKQFALQQLHNKNIPLADIFLNAQLSNSFAQSELIMKGLTEQPIKMNLQLPVELSLLPFTLDINKVTQNQLNAKLNADINLHNLQSWFELDQQLLEGYLITDLAIAGSLNEPELLGGFVLKDGKYENAQTGTLLHDIALNFNAKNKTLFIEEFSANDSEKGKIKGKGQLTLAPKLEQKYQLEMNMESIKILRRDDMNMQISGDIQLDGDIDKGEFRSQIIIEQGEVLLPETINADIPQLKVVEIYKNNDTKKANNTEKPIDSYPLELDISIVVPSKFYVRGRGLESEWQGEISISKQLSSPLMNGALEVKRGYFNFMSHRFNFRQGNINFVGGIPPQPQLDFEMAAAGKDMMAVLQISGEAENPEIELLSEPMMPNDEILSRLLFNKDISEISSFEALQLASAVRTLTTGGSGFMDKTRGSLGVDTIDFNGDEGTGGSVKVGKHISEDVYVEVESGLTSGESEIKVEMDVTDHISVESRVDQESNTGVGVNWKFDY